MRNISAGNSSAPRSGGYTRARYHRYDPISFAREALGFHPDPHQERVLDPSVRRGILNCCRQWGKSTTLAALAIWKAVHNPGSLTVVCAPCARQSAEFVRKASEFLHRLDLPIKGDGDNLISRALPNGSRIVGLPGDEANIRGFSNVALLLIDEASRVPDRLYRAVRPMTAANAEAVIWLLSTPNGRQGFFYEEWTRENSDWVRIEVPATQCPRIRPEFLEEECRVSEQDFRQEYLCEFLAADLAYFDPEAIADAFTRGVGFSLREASASPQSSFYLGLDLGQARDYSALALAERRVEFTGTRDPVTFAKHSRTCIVVDYLERIPLRTPYPEVVERVRRAVQRHPHPGLQILMDATGVGAAVKDMLRAAKLGHTIHGVTITGGERVSLNHGDYHVPRHDLLANLRVLLEKRMIEITAQGPIAEALRTELNRWGQHSAHDDLVFAAALACWKAAGQPLLTYSGGPLPMYPESLGRKK